LAQNKAEYPQLEIDIQSLPPGLYMLNLLIGTEYRYLKLVVE